MQKNVKQFRLTHTSRPIDQRVITHYYVDFQAHHDVIKKFCKQNLQLCSVVYHETNER